MKEFEIVKKYFENAPDNCDDEYNVELHCTPTFFKNLHDQVPSEMIGNTEHLSNNSFTLTIRPGVSVWVIGDKPGKAS